MNRSSFFPESSRGPAKPAVRREVSSEATGTQLHTASSGEYAESVAQDWTPEDDDSPPDTPDRVQQAPDIHALEAADLLERFLGPGSASVDEKLISADGALKRAKPVAQHTAWHRGHHSNQEHSSRARQVHGKSKMEKKRSKGDLHRISFTKYGTEAADLVRRFIEGPPGIILAEQFACRARLVLHFDINKTIIMTDKAQGSDLDQMLNMLLSECAWGRLEPGPKWVPVGRLATDRPASDPQLMSYRIFLDSFLFPFKYEEDSDVEAVNNAIKAQRQQRKRIFTEESQPGDMFRGVFEQLRQKLTYPGTETVQQRILPSFFELLKHLHAQDRDFTIVFRSFGSDIAQVIEEINLFATGCHPHYPEVLMDGTNGKADLRMSMPENVGAFYRSSTKIDGTTLCLGASEKVMTARKLSLADLESCAAQSGRKLLRTFPEMRLAFLRESSGFSSTSRAYALRDYYPFWKRNDERSVAGKLLLLDVHDQDHIQIFFDDNIGYGSPHIVDVRYAKTGQPVSFKEVNGKHLLKAEPMNAILDPQYFIRQVHECVIRVLNDRAAKEQQVASQSSFYRTRQWHENGIFPNTQTAANAPWAKPVAVANTSTRAKALWGVVSQRLVGAIRARRAFQGT